MMMTSAASSSYPRAAVSVVILSESSGRFVLVQRGREPNKGLWSLPGGKIEWGEPTLAAAQREVLEETRLGPNLVWYQDGAFCVTDSITTPSSSSSSGSKKDDDSNAPPKFHYVICQCFATTPTEEQLQPNDDAADAAWHSVDEVRQRLEQSEMTPGVLQVLEKAQTLYDKGLLPCT